MGSRTHLTSQTSKICSNKKDNDSLTSSEFQLRILYVAFLSIAKMLLSNFHQKSMFICESNLAMKLHLIQRKNLRICMVKAMTLVYNPEPSKPRKGAQRRDFENGPRLQKIVKNDLNFIFVFSIVSSRNNILVTSLLA